METNKKILIIDDEADLAGMIAFQFKSKGFEVMCASDGFDALEKLLIFRPDLIILDMNMPRMGGIEFYSKICDDNGKPMFPVLVLTARANVQGLFKDLKIDGFMIKPFEIDQLIDQAELIIKNSSKMKEAGSLIRPRKITIVEHDKKTSDQLSNIFINAEYTTTLAKSGASAIEKIMLDVPDVAIVQLGLLDMAGDTLILRLSHMAKTMGVKFILYTHRDAKHEERVMERISTKTGIFTFVEYKAIDDLLNEVNKLF